MSQQPNERPPANPGHMHTSRLAQGLVIVAIMALIVISLVTLR
jgi:hypothetical protein